MIPIDLWDICEAIKLVATDDSVIEVSAGRPAMLFIRFGRNPRYVDKLGQVEDMGFTWTTFGSEWIWCFPVNVREDPPKD